MSRRPSAVRAFEKFQLIGVSRRRLAPAICPRAVPVAFPASLFGNEVANQADILLIFKAGRKDARQKGDTIARNIRLKRARQKYQTGGKVIKYEGWTFPESAEHRCWSDCWKAWNFRRIRTMWRNESLLSAAQACVFPALELYIHYYNPAPVQQFENVLPHKV